VEHARLYRLYRIEALSKESKNGFPHQIMSEMRKYFSRNWHNLFMTAFI